MSQMRQMNYCKICKKKIYAKVWKIHVMGKKHLYFTPKVITVTGAFNCDNVDEVHNYFSQFGTIGSKTVLSENGKVSIQYSFQDKRAHSFIIYKEHRLFNQPVDVTWDETKGPFPGLPNINKTETNSNNYQKLTRNPETTVQRRTISKEDSAISKRNILNSIKDGANFSEQLTILLDKLQPNKDQLNQNIKLIYEDLTSALAQMFALSRIYFFGSSISGLYVEGSDLDVYIENVKESTRPEVKTLKLIRRLIFKCRKFCDVLLISGAKIPIIKCIHTKTQMCCDLNIKNKLSVCNSELIKYYLSLDDKLRPLMIFIKFWAECYDLKKEPFKLPTVRDLQNDIPPDLVEGWNCAFVKKEFSSVALETVTIETLVAGFFRFYKNFDYVTYMISPYLGTFIRKECFLKPYDLPECFKELDKQPFLVNSGVCIQDPFELRRNVASMVPLQCVGKFAAICNASLHLMEKNEKDLLYQLLTHKTVTDYSFTLDKPIDVDTDQWKTNVNYLIEKLLKEVLSMKVIQSSSIYTCVCEQNIWDHRVDIFKNLLTQLPVDTNDLDRNIAVSKCIFKYFPQTMTTNMSVNVQFNQNPDSVSVHMKPLNRKCKNFLHVAHFFRLNLLKYLEDPSVQENKVPTPPPPALEDKTRENYRFPDAEMTQKDDKISEENDTSNADLSGKRDDTSESVDTAPISSQQNDEKSTENEDEQGEEEEEEEEDVPADFFDDFSNQDFMDGLDIVDAWDDEARVEDKSEETMEKKPHSPIRFIKSKSSERRKRNKSNSRSPQQAKRSKSRRSRSRDKIRISGRRDPEKTRRDIHNDKIKVAKDRELKIVNDKLRIVETGLVPPGTEMDVDLNVIISEKRRTDEKLRERDLVRDREIVRERDRELARERERERELIRERERERELGRDREAARERNLARERELKTERERRYPRRSSSREAPPRRRHSPSPRSRGRERDTTHRIRRRTSSMESNLSEREVWIRSGRKRSRSRSKSRSRDRRSKSSKYEEAKKKKSFLEEIRDKLNETRNVVQSITATPTQNPVYGYSNAAPHPIATHAPAPVPNLAPTPVPAPVQNQYFQQNLLPQYDQRFFIGDVYQAINYSMVQATQMQPQLQSPVQPPVRTPQQTSNNKKIHILSNTAVESNEEQDPIGDVDRLFADKKISLSDFLTITAKCEVQSSSPEHLQKKIKVISRCQEAIRVMSDDLTLTGRLNNVKVSETKNKNETKYQSPLRRIPVVRFHFTSPAKINEDTDVFSLALDKILQKIGVIKEIIDLDDTPEAVAKLANSSFADEETVALAMKANQLEAKKSEKSECEECKKRKMKSFAEVGSQCVENKNSVSIGVQVSEEDLSPTKGLLKNDSIAYLTPAQLLGKSKEKDEKMLIPEKQVDNKPDPVAAIATPPMRKMEKPPSRGRGRGSFRKPPHMRERLLNTNYEYDHEEYYEDFYDSGRYEELRDNFGRRLGGAPMRYPRGQYIEEEDSQIMHLHQFREEDGNFTDFSQPYRGRGRGGFGPRF